MKIRYFVHCYEGYDANDPYNLFRYAIIIDPEGREFGNYLTSALSSNFPAYHPEDVDKVLSEIAKLERGEIDITGWGGDPGFEQTITREGVTFEHGPSVNVQNGHYGHAVWHSTKPHCRAGASSSTCPKVLIVN